MRTRTFLLPFALALIATSLAAQDPHWGVQGALSLPAGDLANSADLGLQGGAHVRWNFGGGHGLVARVDLTQYGRKDGESDSSLGVAADYTFHLNRNSQGLYFLAGLSILDYHWYIDRYDSGTNSALGLDLGVGYDLDRHLGVQARYTGHSVSGASLSALNLGVTYTF